MKLLERKLIDSVRKGKEEEALFYYKKLMHEHGDMIKIGCSLRAVKNYLVCINTLLYRMCDEIRLADQGVFEARNNFIPQIDRARSFKEVYDLGREILFFYTEVNKHKYSYTSHPVVNQALNYIHNNLDKDLTLEKISREIHISKSHLCNLFPIYTKCSFSCYINRAKIAYAKTLLGESSKPLIEIAFECGFNSQSYFCSTFKKVEGMTPLQYKKKHLVKSSKNHRS